jgi:hypothetical protein
LPISTERILRAIKRNPETSPHVIARNLSNYKTGNKEDVASTEDIVRVARANGITMPGEERYAYLPKNEPVKTKTVWEYLDKKVKTLPHYTEFLDVIQKHQALDEKLSNSQTTGTIKIETDKEFFPVNLTADWHLGSVCVDYDAWQRLFHFILDNEIYQMLFGDLTDNFKPPFRSMTAIFSQIFSPEKQVEFLASVIEEYKAKRPNAILAAWWGNHDVEWDENKSGTSPIKDMLSEDYLYFNGMGVIELQVNDHAYRLGGSHVFKGHSMYNRNHSQGRAVREHFGGLVDVVVQGDKHVRAYQLITEYELFKEFGYSELGGDIHLVQVPTYKKDDGYAKRYFSPTGGQIGSPTILFGADNREIIYADNFSQLKRYL